VSEPSPAFDPEPVPDPVPDPARQSELDLGLVPTGDPRVDAALAALEGLPDRPVDEHPAVFEEVHQGLHAALSDVPDPNG
jgi:hypothetical protein